MGSPGTQPGAEGGTPKDGPSAGITLATTIASALTKVPVRSNVAMTGEITLRGRVLPIGGLKEKMIAAHRGGVDTVIIPKDNEKDIKDLPAIIKKAITIIPVEHVDEVLARALAIPDPGNFLSDEVHEIDDIYIDIQSAVQSQQRAGRVGRNGLLQIQ